MSTVVSEGIPTDGRIFQPPVDNTDREAPRYLGFIGNCVIPKIAKDRPWTQGGGVEVANPCLRFVKNFLRKGRITPLLKDTHDFMPYDMVKKWVDGEPEQNGWFRQTVPLGYQIPNLPPARGGGYGNIPSPTGNMVGKIAYPGDQINWILTGPTNITADGFPRGIVEFTSLKGHDYKPSGEMNVDQTIWQIQTAIFPQYPFMPVLLDEIEALLDDATRHTAIRDVVDNWQEGFTQFKNYATTIIQNTHFNMKEAGNKGRDIPKYTDFDLVLLEQLGIDRQDREIKKSVQVAAASDPELREMFKAWMQSQIEEKELIKQSREALAPTEAQPENVSRETSHACECGKYPREGEKSSPQGLSLHKRRYCELRETTNDDAISSDAPE